MGLFVPSTLIKEQSNVYQTKRNPHRKNILIASNFFKSKTTNSVHYYLLSDLCLIW